MPRIPRTEPSEPLRMANQPTMPTDLLTGPGKALQGLGKAISGLSGDFGAAAEPSEEEKFTANLALVKFQHDIEMEQARRQDAFTGVPDGFTQSSVDYFNTAESNLRSSISQNPKIQRQAALHLERLRGNHERGAYGFEAKERQGQMISAIGATATGEVARTQPGNVDELDVRMQGVERMIDAAPGLSEPQRQGLRSEVNRAALSRILDSVPEEQQLDVADKLIKGWTENLSVPPKPVGPQSSIEMQDFTSGRKFAALPAERVSNIVLHDVSGDPSNRRLPKGGNIPHYHLTFDEKGIYNEIALDQRAPHAAAFNKHAIGIAHIGFEDDKLSPQAIANGAKAVKMVADRFGVAPENILTHPGAGPSATKSGGKDAKEASWRSAVLDYIEKNMGGFAGPAVAKAGGVSVNLTAYSPQAGGDKMEGGYAAAKPGPDGKAEVRTLADVAAGRSQYVTLAGNPRDYGKSYTIPEITFVDVSGNRKTLKNVKGVVHDTGSAFKDAPEGRFDVPIDRDATDRQMSASHTMWKQQGVKFVSADMPTPMAQRGIAQYAGSQQVKVADASGAVPERAQNTIPGADGSAQQQVATQPTLMKPSIRTQLVEQLVQMRPALVEKHQKAVKRLEGAVRVSQYVSGEVPFNGYSDADRKLVDETFKLGDLDKRMFAGDAQAIARGVEIAQRLNYTPQVVTEALTGLVKSSDPKDMPKRAMGYEGAASILDRNPNAFAASPGGKELAEEAETYTALVRAGKPMEAAILRIDEMKSPEWQAKSKVRKEAVTEIAKRFSTSSIRPSFDESWLPFTTPDAQFGDMLLNDFTERFREHYVRTGDQDASKLMAAADLKKVYGVSNVTGTSQIMMYPPDNHYPLIGDDKSYLQNDLEKTVNEYVKTKTPQGVEPVKVKGDAIRIVSDGRTASAIASGKPPTYQVMYRDERGLWQIMPNGRWGLGVDDIDKVRKGVEGADAEKRRIEGEKIKRQDESKKEFDKVAPHILLRKGAQGVIDYFNGSGEAPKKPDPEANTVEAVPPVPTPNPVPRIPGAADAKPVENQMMVP